MYLKFTTLEECQNCITELNNRMNLNSNITNSFAEPKVDIDGNYIIPKPKAKILNDIKILVRNIKITNDLGTFDGIEIVKKQFDEDGNDITKYDDTEYQITKQKSLDSLFNYSEVENVEFPVIEEV